MDTLLIERLLERDSIESRFQELFIVPEAVRVSDKGREIPNDTLTTTISRLRSELKSKQNQIASLREVINVKNKDSEKLNDEIISLNIENNILQKKFEELEEEHNKLVKRWLDKVQKDVETLNADFR
ncbi:related to Autophagy-related protein 16 [Zygosaccharomyces bailii]|nr:related to Autophagy-related protein 16 [Zygosaccharomyces bailii ISA1307]SJM84926.1 related to Autophagy-related protein 16 [Zygosaccharomyces bailii]